MQPHPVLLTLAAFCTGSLVLLVLPSSRPRSAIQPFIHASYLLIAIWPHLGSGAGWAGVGVGGAGAWLGSGAGEAGPCLPQSPRPSPSPRPQGGPGSWPTLFKLPMPVVPRLCWPLSRVLAFSLGSREGVVGGGSQMLALAPPLSHTQWDRNKAGGGGSKTSASCPLAQRVGGRTPGFRLEGWS